MGLDEIDLQVLRELQTDGRISNVELARRVNLSPPATHARIRRLQQQGYIKAAVAIVDREKLGFDLLCFIQISLQMHQLEQVERFRQAVRQMPEVLECYHLTGEYDYLLKVVIRNRQDLERFVVGNLTPLPGVARIHTSVVFSEIKSATALPIG
ncbi:MAG: Lrp/AsnC family transcriptional regulator [Anaerolineae bacterium]|uniref:Lrp/AsnC family transcriptional regulator n=1 Tax=Candidatus Amarolinea dominans TaxID=3140696 RepID=UPI001E052847|nr:Lrp/AsnC family transcriptional regulator [Anaerolineae bacterium]MBK7203942.1 Lrp/AsnC family transcriptional regulator [Anaerolineae bacterium]MBK9092248.1 Lrp/AsnC family transcriptional regulator [Anaerolineae bacterium]MBK9229459.1 Lrp/AsnC family transcriptional regulator [Anaerolineae bacterium]